MPPTGPRGPPLLRAGRRSLARLAPPRLPTLPLLLTCGKPSSALDPDTFSEGGGSCGKEGGWGGERVVSNLLFVSPLPAGFRLPPSPPSRAPHSPTRDSTWTRLRERGKGAETGVSGAGGRPPLAPWPLQPWTRRRVEERTPPPPSPPPPVAPTVRARQRAAVEAGTTTQATRRGGEGDSVPRAPLPLLPLPNAPSLCRLAVSPASSCGLRLSAALTRSMVGEGAGLKGGGGGKARLFRERGVTHAAPISSLSRLPPSLPSHTHARAPWACEQTRARVPLRVRPRRHRTESERRDEARVPPRHHHGHPAAAAARPRGRGRV